ncbi:MAG: hypothetical protein ACYDAR_17975 [Thermomicrobiales bacterium]
MAARQTENEPDDQSESRHIVKRRGLIAGAAALVASAAVLRQSQSVAATDINTAISYKAVDPFTPNYVLFGDASTLPDGYNVGGLIGSGKGDFTGVKGVGGNNSGLGVVGFGGTPNGIGMKGNGAGTGAGVWGIGGATSGAGVLANGGTPNGNGVEGNGTGTGVGVVGFSNVTGVQGNGGGDPSNNTTGFPIGVRGSVLNTGYGVYGTVANGAGVYGVVTGSGTAGVYGIAPNGADGVYGQAAVGASKGVYGKHTGGGYGVYGDSNNGHGVYGTTNSGGYGVTGFSPDSLGVYGASTSGIGVLGATGGTGLVAGVYGTSNSAYGIIGNTTASGYSGLTGTTSTPGVAALAATALVTTAYAAYFSGKTVVEGDFYVVKHADGSGGGKFAAVAHADGSYRGVYCTESPEPWFEDFGKAKVVNGKAEVRLEPEFAALIHTADYHVFLTAYGNTNGLHVVKQSATGFTVEEHNGGKGSTLISWRVVGKRADIKGERLPRVTLPKINHPDPDKLPKPQPPKKP